MPFDAQEGFYITSANFIGQSVNHVTKGPDIQIADGGKRVIVSVHAAERAYL